MSVFKRKGAEEYEYDFQYRNHRFCGRTGEKSKRAALAVEADKKLEAKAKVDADRAAELAVETPRTWDVAASRYWHEIGQHHKNSKTTFACLAWLTKEIGAKTALEAIDTNKVALLVAKRRNQVRRVGRAENRTRPVSPATVNRTMTEPLRKVLHRAKEVWGSPVAKIRWTDHMLAEPKERVREASKGEEARIMAQLVRGYEHAVRFAFITGCRRMEIVGLRKTDVDFFSRQFTVTGKGNRLRVIPMNSSTYALLWDLKDDPTEFVFTYTAARTDARKRLVKGQRYPITDAGLRTAMRRATSDAGVGNFRFHDTRHTAATRVLRKANLRVVQDLLGHADVATTAKYAHAMKEDVRAALEAANPVKSTVTDHEDDAKLLESKPKDGLA